MKQGVFFPRKQQATAERGRTNERQKRPRWLQILLILVILGSLIGGGLYWRASNAATNTTSYITLPVTRGNLNITVEGSGTVQPKKSLDLPFPVEGQVREVLVEPGQQVKANQPLARLDDRALRFAVQQAEADLQSAQADLEKVEKGAATPQDIAQAQALVQARQAELEKARTGNITNADLRAAEATLQAAQARLALLKDPSPERVNTAQAALTEAQKELERVRNELSLAKTTAQRGMDQAASTLVQAQSSYSTAYHNWQYAQSTGNDPIQPSTEDPTGRPVDNSLSEGQRQQYYDAYVKAEAELRKAEEEVAKARAGYETAQQQEQVGIQAAEAKVEDAQKQLTALMNPRPLDLAEAQADVAQAQAQLAKLRQGGTRADVSGAQAQVDDAQAGLEKLTAPAAAPDISAAKAAVVQAQAQVDAAKLALDNATLVAPFDGTITTVSVVPGSIVSPTNSVFTLVDLSSWQISAKMNENDITLVQAGQPVQITFDTIPSQVFTGTVTLVATAGTAQQGVVTYPVEIRFDPKSAPVKLGMTSNVSITVDRRENVLLVPNQAIQSDGTNQTIRILHGQDRTPITLRVETGATDGSSTEIVSCVDTGNLCLREGDPIQFEAPEGALEGGANSGDMLIPGAGNEAPPSGAPDIQQVGP